MRQRVKITAIVSLVMLTSAPGHPQSAPQDQQVPAKLSVAQAISIALQSNAKIKESQAGYQNAASDLKVAGFLTTYDAGSLLRLERNQGDNDANQIITSKWSLATTAGTEASVIVAPMAMGSSHGALGVTLRKPLFAGNGIYSDKFNQIESARASFLVRNKDLYLSRQSLTQDVVESYYRAVLSREKVGVADQALQIAQLATDEAKKRFSYELVPKIEVSRAEIRLAQTTDGLNQARQQAKSALDSLMLTMGLGVGSSPELLDPLPEKTPDVPSLEEAIKTALDNRAELEQYDIRLKDQQRELAVRTDRLRPSLDAIAGVDTESDRSGILSGPLYALGSFSVGLEYRVPLDRRAIVEERESAARDLGALTSMRDLAEEQVVQQVRNAYRALEQSQTSLAIYTDNLEVAKNNLDLAQRMVYEGLRDNRDILDAQDNLARVQSGVMTAKVDLYLASINVKNAMGEDLTSMGVK